MANNETKKEQGIMSYALDELMGDRFGRYAKYIIQERALPDVRDGLKPVQRRVLFAMNEINVTYDKPFKKSARIVGDVIGKYHPHGDTSVYDALVRMSQWWKNNEPLVTMHGNNGSIDGDDAAAMRYTESRLSKIASLLLKDLEKNTVLFAPNFDDSEREPTVLPGYFPNVLANGASGIAAGYATNMPPHNLGELLDALILIIKNKKVSFDDIMKHVIGPDFPTGGIIMGREGIRQAFETGKGRIILRSKYHRENNNLIIDEIPYEVIKQDLVKKIGDFVDNNPQVGVREIRDETDRTGLRIVIEINDDVDFEIARKMLLKNTPLQVSYNYNNVVIVDKQPKLLGIQSLLNAYLAHVSDVYMKKTKFEFDKSEKRLEIVEGLIKAVSILDRVIEIIRASKNRGDAILNLVNEFQFTENQGAAIVDLRLYRLTSTDLVKLEEEKAELHAAIEHMQKVINNPNVFNQELINIFTDIKVEYASKRKTEIVDEIENIDVEIKKTIIEKNYQIWISSDGYLKAIDEPMLQKNANNFATFKRKPNDLWIASMPASSLHYVILVSSAGVYYLIPVYKIKEAKWNAIGMHVNEVATMGGHEKIISAYVVKDFANAKQEILIATKKGMIKRTPIELLETKLFSKAFRIIKLQEGDEIVSADLVTSKTKSVAMLTSSGYSVRYDIAEIPSVGQNTKGVKSTVVKDDEIVAGIALNDEDLVVMTNRANIKRLKQSDVPLMARPKRGIRLFPYNKKANEAAIALYQVKVNDQIEILNEDDELKIQKVKDLKLLSAESVCDDLDFEDIVMTNIQRGAVVKNGDVPPKPASSDDDDSNKVEVKPTKVTASPKKVTPKVTKAAPAQPRAVEEENTVELQVEIDDILD
jgi:topoisomerase-4 subunit A